jgi:spore coat polysaccharide biosynthesis protein SpsF
MTKIDCIIQARMGSTRLPGKVMMKVDKTNTILSHVINQLKNSKKIDKIIIATTDLQEDDVIVNHAKILKTNLFRGNAVDVLDRYYQCAKKFSSKIIVRITADNPLIDPNIVDDIINQFLKNSSDYITNANPRTYPYGTEVEVFSFQALEKASNNAKKPSEREHVTPYFHNNKEEFKMSNIKFTENLSYLRWTVDRENDLKFVRKIISEIKSRPILMTDIIKLISQDPAITSINNTNIPNNEYLKSLENHKFLNK